VINGAVLSVTLLLSALTSRLADSPWARRVTSMRRLARLPYSSSATITR